jgi:hypothetical protein
MGKARRFRRAGRLLQEGAAGIRADAAAGDSDLDRILSFSLPLRRERLGKALCLP